MPPKKGNAKKKREIKKQKGQQQAKPATLSTKQLEQLLYGVSTTIPGAPVATKRTLPTQPKATNANGGGDRKDTKDPASQTPDDTNAEFFQEPDVLPIGKHEHFEQSLKKLMRFMN